MLQSDLTILSKEQLTELLQETYARAQPINDQMVDISMEIHEISTEVYTRAIAKHLPGVPISHAKCVLAIGANVNPRQGLPELIRRIANLKELGHDIDRVEFNKTLNEFRFYTK